MNKGITHKNLLSVGARLLNLARAYFVNDLTVTYKSQNDAVSDFDLYLQDKIRAELSVLDPGANVLSEEDNFKCGTPDAWIIDPLDGTSNYIQSLAPTAIAVAKICGEKVLASLVIDINSGDIYTAVKDGGAELNGEQLTSKDTKIKLLGVSSGYLKRGGQIPDRMNARILGSQAIHLCMVARGIFFACVNYEAKAWDDVAGSLIISESGGAYSNRYIDKSWIELALEGASLASVATNQAKDVDEFKNLLGDIINE